MRALACSTLEYQWRMCLRPLVCTGKKRIGWKGIWYAAKQSEGGNAKILKVSKVDKKKNIAVLYGKQNDHNKVSDEKLDRLREFCTSIQTLTREAVLDSMQPWHFPSLLLWTSVNFPSSFNNLLPSACWLHQSSTNRSVLEPFHVYFATLNMQPEWILEKIMSGVRFALFTKDSHLTFV